MKMGTEANGHFHSSMKSPDSKKGSDLYEDMKPLLYFGRLTLVIPYGKSDSPFYKEHHKFGLGTISQLCNIALISWTCVTFGFEVKGMMNMDNGGQLGVMGYVSNSQDMLTTMMEAFIFFYFLKNSPKFYSIFDRWSIINRKFHLKRDKWLYPLALILILCPLLQQGLTCLFYYDVIEAIQRKNLETSKNVSVGNEEFADSNSIIRLYYERTLASWKDAIPYNFLFVVISFFLRLLKSIPWYSLPTFIMFYARALAFQYKVLIQEAVKGDHKEAHFTDMKKKDKSFWTNLVKKHQALSLLVKTINSFLTPLIFLWVTLYIYIISLELFRSLFEGVASDASSRVSVVVFVIETTQFMVTLISATKVNTYATKLLNVLRNCPREHYYDTEVCRLVHQITTGPNIAFTGLGCFSITRPFLIKIFNGVFTMEIILLQSAESVVLKK